MSIPYPRQELLSIRHPVLWGSLVPLALILLLALPLKFAGFNQAVTWACLAILFSTGIWFAWFALVMTFPGIGPWHYVFTRIACDPVRPSPGLCFMCAAPFNLVFTIMISVALIKSTSRQGMGPGGSLDFLWNQQAVALIILSAMGLLGICTLVGLRRVWSYRRSGKLYCQVCGNDLEHAPSGQCTECGCFHYRPPG